MGVEKALVYASVSWSHASMNPKRFVIRYSEDVIHIFYGCNQMVFKSFSYFCLQLVLLYACNSQQFVHLCPPVVKKNTHHSRFHLPTSHTSDYQTGYICCDRSCLIKHVQIAVMGSVTLTE